MDEKSTDSLAGRKRIFTLYPLSFQEFLLFNGRNDLVDLLPQSFHADNFHLLQELPLLYRNDLAPLFSDYARFGGYPRVVLAETEDEKKAVLEDLVHSGVKKDVLESGVKNPQKYYDLYKILCSQAGALVNRSELSKTIQLSLPAVERYLYVMQKSFHLTLIRSFHHNIRKEIVKLPKVYLLDTGIRNYLVGDFNDMALRADKGPLLESLAFRQFLNRFPLDDIKFWRTQDKNELDFVIQDRLAFEVKAISESFSIAKYSNFIIRNPNIPVNVVTYDRVEDKGLYQIWPVWGI
jgi:predicted AAA+ superfamily ATPase